MLVAALSLPCAGYLAARPHAPARPRASPPVAYFSFDKAPEMVSLKDQLMEASVQHQLQHFRSLNEEGLLVWLKATWETYAKSHTEPGAAQRFVDEMLRTQTENVFVPMQRFQQGSPSNPYTAQRPMPGYMCEVEPHKIARRLMESRKQEPPPLQRTSRQAHCQCPCRLGHPLRPPADCDRVARRAVDPRNGATARGAPRRAAAGRTRHLHRASLHRL